jgi:hypothetical protein
MCTSKFKFVGQSIDYFKTSCTDEIAAIGIDGIQFIIKI